ncbi:hypothetical protein [Oceanobacter mangrovi]|uniref:hypothetical protein n=1 Tax=Oceanobacter mangrovi TaxID=2862510 RepID=UPI001C8E18BE|nr:hypothetical protein [Oceanobacter mangrovi]
MHLASFNRYQAFGIHFGLSLLIFLGLVALVFTVWYPGVLFDADNGWQQALLMIAGVDLVLGPLLTLLVYNPAKKSLKMDLSIIAAFQFCALVGGIYTVNSARPVGLYVAFPPAGYEILYARSLAPETLAAVEKSDQRVFYYQPGAGGSPFGPERQQDLKPAELKPVDDGGYGDFINRLTNDPIFKKDNTLRVPVGPHKWVVTDDQGKQIQVLPESAIKSAS